MATLRQHRFQVEVVGTIRDAEERLQSGAADLLAVQRDLEHGSGIAYCASVRHRTSLPVIILETSRARSGGVSDRVAAFEAGADEYIDAAMHPLEVVRRVEALLRRAGPLPGPEILPGPCGSRLDPHSGDLWRGEQMIRLTKSERGVLALLVEHRGSVVTAEELARRVWQYEVVGDTNFIQHHVSRLRRKLASVGVDPESIETIYGAGYRLKDGGEG